MVLCRPLEVAWWGADGGLTAGWLLDWCGGVQMELRRLEALGGHRPTTGCCLLSTASNCAAPLAVENGSQVHA